MIRARTIMNGNPVRLEMRDSVQKAARQMADKKAKMALVFDRGQFIGVLTEEELFAETFVKGKASVKGPISSIVRKDFLFVDAGYAVDRIERSYKDDPKSRYVVTEGGVPIGIVTEIEHVASMRDFTHYHYVMQEAILAIFGITTAFFLFFFSPFGAFLRGG